MLLSNYNTFNSKCKTAILYSEFIIHSHFKFSFYYFHFTIFIFRFLISPSYAQDLHFSQFYNAPYQVNPATVGTGEGDWRIFFNHKSQWIGITSFNTSSAAYETRLLGKKKLPGYLGIGANAFSDRSGDASFGTTQGNITVSGIIPLGENHKLSAGLAGGFAQRSANLSKLTWGNQFNGQGFDANLPSNEANQVSLYYPDVAGGVYYEYRSDSKAMLGEDVLRFNAGISVFHPHAPTLSYISQAGQPLNTRFVFHATAYKDFNEMGIAFFPSVVYYRQSSQTETITGISLRYRLNEGTRFTGIFSKSALWFGCQYRMKDALIPNFAVEFGNYLVTLSYDYPMHKIEGNKMAAGFEVSFIYSMLTGRLRKN